MNVRYLIYVTLVIEFFILFLTSEVMSVRDTFCRDSKNKIEPCRCSGKPGSFVMHCFTEESTQTAIGHISSAGVTISSFYIGSANLKSKFFGDAKVEKVNFNMVYTLTDQKIPQGLFKGQEDSLKDIVVSGSLSDLQIFVRELTELKKLRKLHVKAFFLKSLEPFLFDCLNNPESMEDLKLGNNIKSIGTGAFNSLKNLKRLDLSLNGLKTMDGCFGQPMTKLVFFKAQHNDFMKFPSFLREAMEGAEMDFFGSYAKTYFDTEDVEAIVTKNFKADFFGKNFRVYGTTVMCTCAWYPLAKLSDAEKSKLKVSGNCAYPEQLKNKALVKLNINDIPKC